jgi:arsenate reductase
MPHTPSVLFVCTGNAGRSQMAQAMLRARMGASVDVESAGVAPWPHLHPVALSEMTRRGLSLEGHRPKSAESVADRDFDLVVTLGDPALRRLPHRLDAPSGRIHWDIPDPADADGTPLSETRFREAADAIAAGLPDLERWIAAFSARDRARSSVGVSTCLWRRCRLDPAIHLREAAAAGFDAVEICNYQGPAHFDPADREAVRELRRVADDLGLSVWAVHTLDPGSLGSPDPSERARQTDEILACMDLAEYLGARVVVSHGLIAGRFAEDPAQADRILDASLKVLLPRAESGPVRIAFENDAVMAPGRTGLDLVRRLEPFSSAAFGFVLDTGHANIAGDLEEIAGAVGHRLISLHLNDNDGRGDLHLVPGEGITRWPDVRRLLRDTGYGGCMLYEVGPGAGDPGGELRRMMERHRSLFPEPERP